MHSAHIGITGSGKTYAAIRIAKKNRNPIIYFNPKLRKGAAYQSSLPGFIRLYPNEVNRDMIRDLLNRRINIEFAPDLKPKVGDMQQQIFVDEAFKHGNVTMIFDEASIYSYEGITHSAAIEVAQRGREAKVFGLFICQSPQSLSKRVLENCDTIRIFDFAPMWASGYLRSKGLDPDLIKSELNAAPKYSYCELSPNGLSKPKKE